MFRVVLTGELVAGFSREAALASLSRFFEVPASDLLGLFSGSDYLIDEELDTEGAAALQRRVEALGVRARVEPATAAAGGQRRLLRMPDRIDPVEAGLMRCPACGHQQLLADRCDECGVVFAEYNRTHPRPTTAKAPPPVSRPAGQRSANRPTGSVTRQQAAWGAVEEDELPTEEYHLRLFMGMRSAHLAGPCLRMAMGQRTVIRPSWLWGAVFSPFLWALFRKMWFWGFVLFVLDVFLPVLAITLGSEPAISDKLVYVGIGLLLANRLFWPVFLKGLYCRHARSTIAYMHRMSPTFAPDIDIAAAGGTSRTSVFVGVVLAIVMSLLTWNAVDSLYELLAPPAPAFVPVPETVLPDASGRVPATPPVDPADALLANENKWVATRSRLRVLGQRLNSWLVDLDGAVDPATLDMSRIAGVLQLAPDAANDGWGLPIRYESDGAGFRLISAGPDGEFGNTDDVDYRRSLRP